MLMKLTTGQIYLVYVTWGFLIAHSHNIYLCIVPNFFRAQNENFFFDLASLKFRVLIVGEIEWQIFFANICEPLIFYLAN